MLHFYWVGIRESDLLGAEDLYVGSITYFGSGMNGNICLFQNGFDREDHNIDTPMLTDFYKVTVGQIMERDEEALFMFYNPLMAYRLAPEAFAKVVCINDANLLNVLGNKTLCKLWLKNLVPLLPNIQTLGCEITFSGLKSTFSNHDRFVVQPDYSSGGYHTYVMDESNETVVREGTDSFQLYSVAPYHPDAISINIHIVIYPAMVQIYPASIQIVRQEHHQLIYRGGDFAAFQMLSSDIQEKVCEYSLRIGEKLRKCGYLGVCGIDLAAIGDTVYFMEINPRFQASTAILNLALQKNGCQSVNRSNIEAFHRNTPQEEIRDLIVAYSFYTYTESEKDKKFYEHIFHKYFDQFPQFQILKDGYQPGAPAKAGAYLFRAIYPHNIVSLFQNQLRTAEALMGHTVCYDTSPLHLKAMLIHFGITISAEALAKIAEKGCLRQANFSAIDLIVNGRVINCPYQTTYSIYSPFELRTENGLFILYAFQKFVAEAEIYYESSLNKKKTTTGIQYSSVAFLATDRLRINYNSVCYFKKVGSGCKFCNLPKENQQYTNQDIQAILEDYLEHENFRHILIGGGSSTPESNFDEVLELVGFLQQKTEKPLYLMSLPPQDLTCIAKLYHAGISEIAFNIEIFDEQLAMQYMPGKGQIPRSHYYAALKEAVRYLGTSGNVRSMVLLGLESEESLLQGIETLCEIGVQPMLSIFRPMADTPMENWLPPSLKEILQLYHKIESICARYGQSLGPTCPYCQNNTLSLPEPLLF